MLAHFGQHAAQHHHGDLLAGLLHLDGLEAPRQGGIFLEIFFVLAPGGGGNGAQLTAGQRRLQQIGGIILTRRASRADQRMGFIDEQNDRLTAGLHLVDDRLETPLELTLDAGARLQQAQIQHPQGNAAQAIRHLAGRNAQGQPLNHGGFPYAGLTGKNRVVLPAAQQNIDHLPNLAIPPENRIQLALAGPLAQVYRVLVQGGRGRCTRVRPRRAHRRRLSTARDQRGPLVQQICR